MEVDGAAAEEATVWARSVKLGRAALLCANGGILIGEVAFISDMVVRDLGWEFVKFLFSSS